MSRTYNTPPRKIGGFGFSYSTYGSPSSTSSTPSTGGVHGSGFGGGRFGRSTMTKSFSASNLRQQYTTDGDGILTPGALAPGSSRNSIGSIRRLTIDRSLKNDLFSRSSVQALPPATNGESSNGVNGVEQHQPDASDQSQKLKKRVSFDHAAQRGSDGTMLDSSTGALVVHPDNDDQETSVDDQGILRSSRRQGVNGNTQSDSNSGRGNELAVVPEDRATDNASSNMRKQNEAPAGPDPQPGEYWMRPSRAELSKMPREKLQKFKDFTIGRQGCGSVTFNGEVDLTSVPLDDLYGKIVDIGIRSITVYPDASSKPPPGKGLNVPSTLRLENSWPRARNKPSSATSGPLFDKHIIRLKRLGGTTFVDYDTQTGIWTFTVPHYTRYGLDYDDEDEDDESALSSPPEDLPETASAEQSTVSMDVDNTPEESSLEDDTFGYKNKILPGAFGRQPAFEEPSTNEQSFLGERSVADGSDTSEQSDVEESDEEMEMAGSYPQPDSPAERDENFQADNSRFGTPGRLLDLDLDGDWAEQLQRTISPRKQDREALREMQGKLLVDLESDPEQNVKMSKNDFRTSIDVMNSLFGQHEERMAAAKKESVGTKGFEV